ncbi:MAG: HEAT repeat domain-containing protein, partial [Pseudomonadales bacterium]|nr:HEAT repeat domain-containing protein [Pseudomonadales bacterium]
GTFSDITDKTDINSDHWSVAASFADFNNDGLVDIYISNYIRYVKGAKTFERQSGFNTNTKIAFDASLYDPVPNILYMNKGNFLFEDVTTQMKVSNAQGRSLGAKWVDFNDDGWMDLYVINDHPSPNQVYINQQGSSFTRGDSRYAPLEIVGTHDAAFIDTNNNNQWDTLLSRGMATPPALLSLDSDSGSYTDRAWTAGVARTKQLPFSGWGISTADFNNDGFSDIYIANGSTLPDIDAPNVPQAQPNTFFVNNGEGQYVASPMGTRLLSHYSSRGVASVDINNDGLQDIVVANNNNYVQVYKNTTTTDNTWVTLSFAPSVLDAELLGSSVSVTTDKMTSTKRIDAKQSFLSQSDPRIHFGLGKSTVIKEVMVNWKDGSTTLINSVSVNSHYTITAISNATRSSTAEKVDFVSPGNKWDHFEEDYDTSSHLLVDIILASDRKKELNLLWDASSSSTKMGILESISAQWDSAYLPIMKKALNDKLPEALQLKAIKILTKLELEMSVEWLLPLLLTGSDAVQCEIAHAFRFFFDEEEAVIHNKQLAVSPLIKIVTKASPAVRICAAQALAASESKRATLPLIKQLHHKDTEVRAAAVRALGLIRDTSAINPLVELVSAPNSDPATVAASLIALQRLNAPNIQSLISSTLSPRDKKDPQQLIKSLNVLSALFANSERIVFPRKPLLQKVSTLIHLSLAALNTRYSGNTRSYKNNAPDILLAMLKTILVSRDSRQMGYVRSHVRSANSDVRVQALLTMANLTIDEPQHLRTLEKLLLNDTPNVRQYVIHYMLKHKIKFSARFAHSLIIDKKDYINGMAVSRTLTDRGITGAANRIIKSNQVKGIHHTTLQSLLIHCAPPLYVPRELLNHYDPGTRLLAVTCAMSRGPQVKHSRDLTAKQAYTLMKPLLPSLRTALDHFQIQHSYIPEKAHETRKFIQHIVNDTSLDESQRFKLLITFAKFDPIISVTMLVNRLNSIPSTLLPETLTALFSQAPNPKVIAFAWKILKTKSKDIDLRLQSAQYLSRTEANKVMDYLNKTFLRND